MSLSLVLFPYLLVSLYSIMHRYTITEKKNTYIKELFGQYVHPKVLLNILSANTLKLGGERKYITILFADIRGFTTMTELMPAEELVETLNAYLETMSPLIMEREGVIDKYIGDAIMAFWNAPVAVHNHEEKAVRACLAMTEALKTLETKSPLAIGIGLHAGEAIVGNIGSRARINYTIIGDAVNACSRLEGLTKKYGLQIIVSGQIKDAIKAKDILFRKIDRVRVKGKSEVMELYEPILKAHVEEDLLTQSHKAFAAYNDGKFMEALELYLQIGGIYGEMMKKRIEHLLANPPHEWTGVWDWDEK
jgi:adenylate cyclase